jgi:hypothetical protein
LNSTSTSLSNYIPFQRSQSTISTNTVWYLNQTIVLQAGGAQAVDPHLGILGLPTTREALSMKERRKYQRFQLALPAKMKTITAGKKEVIDLETDDISACGAFLQTTEEFSEGTRCQLEMTVPSDRIKELTGAQSLIKVEGTVVRSTPAGVAICFNGKCQILAREGF